MHCEGETRIPAFLFKGALCLVRGMINVWVAGMFAGNASSVILCFWLLLLIGNPVKEPLIIRRQLWHLAFADLVGALCDLPVNLISSVQPNVLPSGVYLFNIAAMEVCWTVSMLLELHIAVGFAAAYYRSRHLLLAIDRTVWLCWLPGLFVLALRTRLKDLGVMMLVLAVTTFMVYLAVALRALWYTGRATQRANIMVFSGQSVRTVHVAFFWRE